MRANSLAVRDRGQVTLPKALRDALRKEFRRLMKKQKVTPDDLLRDL